MCNCVSRMKSHIVMGTHACVADADIIIKLWSLYSSEQPVPKPIRGGQMEMSLYLVYARNIVFWQCRRLQVRGWQVLFCSECCSWQLINPQFWLFKSLTLYLYTTISQNNLRQTKLYLLVHWKVSSVKSFDFQQWTAILFLLLCIAFIDRAHS